MDKTVKTDFHKIVEKERKKGKISEEKARAIVVERMMNSKGYYQWIPMGDEEDSAWLVRTPRNDKPEEVWLKEEPADFVHLCNPEGYLEGAEKYDKDLASKATAYIRDKNNELTNIEEFCCSRCGKKLPVGVGEKVKMYISLYKLGMKK